MAITRSREDGETAFDALFLSEWPKVVRIAQRVLGDGPQAEDAAQEVFLAFHRRFAQALPERPAAWLYAAASHVALNALRGERRRDRREREHGHDAATTPKDPAGELMEREAAQERRAALARLRPASAQLLALRYAGLRYIEISETLGIPVDQVGTRLRRAEQSLRKELAHAASQGR